MIKDIYVADLLNVAGGSEIHHPSECRCRRRGHTTFYKLSKTGQTVAYDLSEPACEALCVKVVKHAVVSKWKEAHTDYIRDDSNSDNNDHRGFDSDHESFNGGPPDL